MQSYHYTWLVDLRHGRDVHPRQPLQGGRPVLWSHQLSRWRQGAHPHPPGSHSSRRDIARSVDVVSLCCLPTSGICFAWDPQPRASAMSFPLAEQCCVCLTGRLRRVDRPRHHWHEEVPLPSPPTPMTLSGALLGRSYVLRNKGEVTPTGAVMCSPAHVSQCSRCTDRQADRLRAPPIQV